MFVDQKIWRGLKQKAAFFHKNGFFKTWFYERAPLNLVF